MEADDSASSGRTEPVREETAMAESILSEQELIYNLQAAGLEPAAIKQYLSCWREGGITRQLRLLAAQRARLLEQVHTVEQQIACLDYLVYRIGQRSPQD